MNMIHHAQIMSNPMQALMVLQNWSRSHEQFREALEAYMYIKKASEEWPARKSVSKITDEEISAFFDHMSTLNCYTDSVESCCCVKDIADGIESAIDQLRMDIPG